MEEGVHGFWAFTRRRGVTYEGLYGVRFLESWRWVVSFGFLRPFRGRRRAREAIVEFGAYGGAGAVRSGHGGALDAVDAARECLASSHEAF